MRKAFLIFALALSTVAPLAQAEVPVAELSAADATAEAPTPTADLELLLQENEAGDGCAAEQLTLNPEPVYRTSCSVCQAAYQSCLMGCWSGTCIIDGQIDFDCTATCGGECYDYYASCNATCT